MESPLCPLWYRFFTSYKNALDLCIKACCSNITLVCHIPEYGHFKGRSHNNKNFNNKNFKSDVIRRCKPFWGLTDRQLKRLKNKERESSERDRKVHERERKSRERKLKDELLKIRQNFSYRFERMFINYRMDKQYLFEEECDIIRHKQLNCQLLPS